MFRGIKKAFKIQLITFVQPSSTAVESVTKFYNFEKGTDTCLRVCCQHIADGFGFRLQH